MKALFTFLLIVSIFSRSLSQGFETVPPILLNNVTGKIDTSVTLIMTPEGRLEIIDAYQPWPPRWFSEFNQPKSNSEHPKHIKPFFENARVQNNRITFFKKWIMESSGDSMLTRNGYIICDRQMEPLDTFKANGLDLNFHDFRINEKGEKLICYILDTVLNLSGLTADPGDTALKARVDIMEILDSSGKIIFRWNPVSVLGVNSLYYRYGHLASRTSKAGHVDWSHANAFSWDFDGNILYSFRHIGIGKISRHDGHVIWRLDRSKMPFIVDNDTLAFYLQHGFARVSDSLLFNTYTLYSNGDSTHPYSFGLEFTVNKKDNALHIVNKKVPVKKITSGSGGNYTVEGNGDYILNYGTVSNRDSTIRNLFFEIGNEHTGTRAEYKTAKKDKSFLVTELNGWKPSRPRIVAQGSKLKAEGEMKEWVWYQLSESDNAQVRKVGEGANFTPADPGIYCVAGKYGIGYSVSLPYHYKL